MRAVPHFGRAFRAQRRVENLGRLQPGAGNLVDRLGEPLAIVGQIDRERRRARGHDPEHVPLVNELARDLLEEILDLARVLEIQVQVVDENQPDPSRRVVGRLAGRKDDALHRRRRRGRGFVVDPATMGEQKRDHVLLDAVFEDLEVSLLQIGDELPLVVADDHVRGDDVEASTDNAPLRGADRLLGGRWLSTSRWRRLWRRGLCVKRSAGCQHRGRSGDLQRPLKMNDSHGSIIQTVTGPRRYPSCRPLPHRLNPEKRVPALSPPDPPRGSGPRIAAGASCAFRRPF